MIRQLIARQNQTERSAEENNRNQSPALYIHTDQYALKIIRPEKQENAIHNQKKKSLLED